MSSGADGNWTADDMVVRRATAADKEAVLAIHEDVYSGFDYLPALYNYFVNSNRFRLFVGELRGKLIGYLGIYVICNSPTRPEVLTMSERVSKDAQGRGVISAMRETAHDHVRQLLPEAKFLSVVARSEHWERFVSAGERKVVQKWVSFRYRLTRSSLEKFIERHEADNDVDRVVVKRLEPSLLAKHFKYLQQLISLYGPYMVHDSCWLIEKVTEKELRNVALRHSVNVSIDQKTLVPSAFSILGRNMAKYGIRNDVHFYGRDYPEFFQHLLTHFKHILATSVCQNQAVIVHFPAAIDKDWIEKNLDESIGPRWKIMDTELWLTETQSKTPEL